MGNGCSSVSNSVPRQFTFTALFPERNGLDQNKMKLVTKIINAENTQIRRFDLSDSKERAINWYDSCSYKLNLQQAEERIKNLGTLHIQHSDLQAYGSYLGYRVDLNARPDGSSVVTVTKLKLQHRATI